MTGITGPGPTGGNSAPSSGTFLTSSDQSATLPSSRNLTAGTNITFDDSVANVRTISAAGASLANPTASVGLTAVNGVATSAIRSDGAPALDQSISPTMTGAWTYTNALPVSVVSAEPRILFNETDQATNEKVWDIDISAKTFKIRTRTDADGAGADLISAVRGTGTALGTMTVNTAINAGTNTVTGRIVAANTSPNNQGLYAPGTNRLGFCTASTQRGEFDANGQFIITTIGRGLSVAEGSNAKMGTATLVAGTVVVSTTAVTATSRIFLTAQSLGTVTVGQGLAVSARTAGTSFTIISTTPTDTSVVAWMLVEPG